MKIVLLESQYKRVKELLNEGVENDYVKETVLNFSTYGSSFKGKEIDGVLAIKINVKFKIEIEARTWGIKSASIHRIIGPEFVETEVSYYVDDEGNTNSETLKINLNWESLSVEEEKGSGMITLDDVVDITLQNNEHGELICKEINLKVFSL